MNYTRIRDLSLPIPVNRTGGWGHLLVDEGPAFATGREAIRTALQHRDQDLSPSSGTHAIFWLSSCRRTYISRISERSFCSLKEGQDPSSVLSDPKLRVAGLRRVVFNRALPSEADTVPDFEALGLVQKAAVSAADSAIPQLPSHSGIRAATSVLKSSVWNMYQILPKLA